MSAMPISSVAQAAAIASLAAESELLARVETIVEERERVVAALREQARAGASVPVGFLATALLVVNNLRDIPTDAVAGKRTLAVRMGDGPTRVLYVALVGAAFAATRERSRSRPVAPAGSYSPHPNPRSNFR